MFGVCLVYTAAIFRNTSPVIKTIKYQRYILKSTLSYHVNFQRSINNLYTFIKATVDCLSSFGGVWIFAVLVRSAKTRFFNDVRNKPPHRGYLSFVQKQPMSSSNSTNIVCCILNLTLTEFCWFTCHIFYFFFALGLW